MRRKRTAIENGVGVPSSPLPGIMAHLAMLDYLATELARRSPMTVFFLKLARQNLLDESVANRSDNGAPEHGKQGE
jgi:hypothetical protein